MGTGKSIVGKEVASLMQMCFIDSDHAIEERIGMSVSQIFAKHGENQFRNLEREFIENGHPEENCVIACGGGLCIPPGMMEALKRKGKVICLWASIQTLVRRTKEDPHRPLLQTANPLRVLENLLREREPRYRQADIIIDTDQINPSNVARNIVRKLTEENE